MKTKIAFLILSLGLCSNITSQIPESTWIDEESEKIMASIGQENGKLYLTIWNQKFKVQGEQPDLYALYHNEKLPLTFNPQNQILRFKDKDYTVFKEQKRSIYWSLEKPAGRHHI